MSPTRLYFLGMAVLAVWSAVLQRNDPDPYVWTTWYAFLAVLCLTSAVGRPLRWGILAGFAACAWLGARAYPGMREFLTNDDGITIGETMSDEHPYIEEMREFGGIAISLVTLGVLLWDARRRRKA